MSAAPAGPRPIVIITGGRDFRGGPDAEAWLLGRLRDLDPEWVYHGGARGADQWAALVAQSAGHPVKGFPVSGEEWARSKGAGFARNRQMAREALWRTPCVRLLAFPGGNGTAHMRRTCRSLGIPEDVWAGP